LLENIATPEARDEFAEAMAKIPSALLHIVIGKGVREKDPNRTETSVTPAWRKAVAHVALWSEVTEISQSAFTRFLE